MLGGRPQGAGAAGAGPRGRGRGGQVGLARSSRLLSESVVVSEIEVKEIRGLSPEACSLYQVLPEPLPARTHACAHVRAHVCAHADTHVHTHMHTHANTCMHMHTHT